MFKGKKRYAIFSSAIAAIGILGVVTALVFSYGGAHAATRPINPSVVSANYLASHHAKPSYAELPPQGAAKGDASKLSHGRQTSNQIPGIDGISNWGGTWNEFGYDPAGNPTNTWTYNMIGNPAQNGKVTVFDNPIVPVKLALLDQNNHVAFTVDPAKDIVPTLTSPVFLPSKYSSSNIPTQYADAVQRAEFHSTMKPGWHTLVAPRLRPAVTLTIPYGDYVVGQNSDGSIAFTLVDYNTFTNEMFPATLAQQSSTIIGQQELNGTMTTKNISTFLFDNTYLYEGDPSQCCILGFHGPDIEPGDASNGNLLRNYAMIYASWASPGLFGPGDDAPQDVTPLSHELSETYNDPFGGAYFPFDTTPWWQSSFNCQDDLEVGDVIEGLPADNTVIKMHGFNYHVQNEALLQWFENQSPSSALDGAYSYPNEHTLTSGAVSMLPNCAGPA